MLGHGFSINLLISIVAIATVFFALLYFLWRRRTPSQAASALERQKRAVQEESRNLEDKLQRSRQGWVARLSSILSVHTQIDEKLYEELEEALVSADIGVQTAHLLLERARQNIGTQGKEALQDPQALKRQLQAEILAVLRSSAADSQVIFSRANGHKPRVLVIVGVNGVGKTTTIGKLALHWQRQGQKVMLAAGDTFRAAAVEQLQIWGQRVGTEVIAHPGGHDPAAVAFDALSAAQARQADLLIVDTAGRLQTKVNLMEELKKVCRTLGKKDPSAPHEIWLVLDATTGQNALQQAIQFNAELGGLTGIVLTKLDGTAKGGILVALAAELKVPIRFIGVGEKAEDLRPFDAEEYTRALFAA